MPPPNQVQKLRGDGQPNRVQDNVGATLDPLAKAVGATPIMGAQPPAWIRVDIAAPVAGVGYIQAVATTAAPVPLTAYHKDALGYVHGKVALTAAVGGAAANSIPFSIGMDSRPADLLLFLMSDGGGNIWEVTIAPNGAFTVVTPTGAGALVTGLFTYLATS